MRKAAALLIAVCSALTAAGCQDPRFTGERLDWTDMNLDWSDHRYRAPPDPLAVEITVPDTVRRGFLPLPWRAVPMDLRIINTGSEGVEVTIGGNPEYPYVDVLIVNEHDRIVWRHLPPALALIAYLDTIGVHDTRRIERTWNLRHFDGERVPPGRYRAYGVVHGRRGDIWGRQPPEDVDQPFRSEAAEFVVVP